MSMETFGTIQVIVPDINLFPEEAIEQLCRLSKDRADDFPITVLGDGVNVIGNLYGIFVNVSCESDPKRLFLAWQHIALTGYGSSTTRWSRKNPVVGPVEPDRPRHVDYGQFGESGHLGFMRERYVKLRNYFATYRCGPVPEWPYGDTCGTPEVSPPGGEQLPLTDAYSLFWLKSIQEAIDQGYALKEVANERLYQTGLYYRPDFGRETLDSIKIRYRHSWPHTEALMDWAYEELWPMKPLQLPPEAQ